jgi:hypothetical protein
MLRVTAALIILAPASIATCQAQTRSLTDAEKKIIVSVYGER